VGNLLATTIFCGAVSIAAPAYAQDAEDTNEPPSTGPVEGAPPESATGDDDSSIIVTGSRIPQPQLTSTSPVTVVNSQEVRLTGTTRTEDLINSLPQAFAAQGGNISNASTGTATLDLRGLGDVRTLVLVNGRRLLPGDVTSSAADINAIPAFMIERVDVLTGGASSVYGADAVAGVVNFIMDTDFEGVRVDSQYSFYTHNNDTRESVQAALNARGFGYPRGTATDGGSWDIGIALGAGFDDGRGHITAYAGYRTINSVLQAKRDYSACSLTARPNDTVQPNGTSEFTCGGSGTSAVGTFFTNVGTFQIGPNRTFISGTTPYNFGPLNYFQRPDERYVGGFFGEYEISRALQPYLELMFMDDRTTAQIAPSGNFFNTTTINCDNPLLSAQQRAIVCSPDNLVDLTGALDENGNPEGDGVPDVFIDQNGNPYFRGVLYAGRRNVEGGGRRDNLQHTDFRVVGGMRGDLSDVWSYDAFYMFGRVNFAESYENDFSVTRLRRALDVVTGPNGAPVCRSVLTGDDPNCVPYDIFALGGVTTAAVNYLATPLLARGVNEETVTGASITGTLGEYGIQSPWAQSGIGVAMGVEYRKERLDFLPDISFQTGEGAGQGAATLPVSGDYDVREAFAEARIPIVEESFIHELSLELGYRYSDYNVQDRSFSTDTYKIAGFFAPVRDIRFRGGYNRAVRAPNIQELFSPQRVALDGTEDPCAGASTNVDNPTAGTVNGNTFAQCARTGVTAGQFGNINANPASQYNGLIGGNVNLDPEIADTYTVGVVIQPRFVPRFALTVDWFDIRVENAIQALGADNIITSCIQSGDPFFCNKIQRAPNGSLWLSQQGFIRDLQENIGGLSTRGIDVGMSYSMDIGGMGNIGLNFQGTWLDELITDQGFDVVFDCVGFFGNQCLVPTPEWRHTARVTWTHPDGYGLTARWRYFSGVDVDDLSDDPDLKGNNIQPGNDHLSSVNYLDLALTFRVGDHYNFRLGVNNVLDRDPPINGSQVCPAGPCNGNTWAQVYDALGRYVFAGVTLDF
jgi:outer membrane receptor protein involved in Fe transport